MDQGIPAGEDYRVADKSLQHRRVCAQAQEPGRKMWDDFSESEIGHNVFGTAVGLERGLV